MQKLYYSISEVCKLVDEEQHILRYWEKEFSQLKPRKNRGGNRIYSTKDISLIQLIKRLLRKDKLSLKGAKQQLDKYSDNEIPEMAELPFEDDIKKQIEEIPSEMSKKSATFSFNPKDAKELLVLLKDIKRNLIST